MFLLCSLQGASTPEASSVYVDTRALRNDRLDKWPFPETFLPFFPVLLTIQLVVEGREKRIQIWTGIEPPSWIYVHFLWVQVSLLCLAVTPVRYLYYSMICYIHLALLSHIGYSTLGIFFFRNVFLPFGTFMLPRFFLVIMHWLGDCFKKNFSSGFAQPA